MHRWQSWLTRRWPLHWSIQLYSEMPGKSHTCGKRVVLLATTFVPTQSMLGRFVRCKIHCMCRSRTQNYAR